ncbi:hypothetical protein [Azoarcus sp. KH32C]|uniref:hypothetical protein n=1 Tax=Azoarcus sp. KH32C TaxID=748247 RepID=UPI0005A203EF|nr:hypothetical protein [Azoarcus sp. KH32C]
MSLTVFAELKFWLLVLFSLVVPVAIYVLLLVRRAVSPLTVLALGLALILIAGFDTYLLQSLVQMAKASASLADDAVFVSELTLGLYLLPALFAGVGVNVISHVLIRHLGEAERQFEKDRDQGRR